jgi:hypothetical protein
MRLIALVAGLGLVGCPDRSISPVAPDQTSAFTKDIPVEANLDLLFVIDDSGSTRDKQKVFAQNYTNFVTALDRFPSGRPNLHIGVVTSSVDLGPGARSDVCHPARGTDGLLQNRARDSANPCAPPTADRFLVDVQGPGGRTQNYAGTLDTALSCISSVGDAGCGFESPLEAIKRALDGSHPENAGFVRPGALLAVVILTDEDDCSATPELYGLPAVADDSHDFNCAAFGYLCDQAISTTQGGTYTGCRVRHDGPLRDPRDYAAFLGALKGPSGVVVAVIAGDPATAISSGRLTRPFTQTLATLPSCMATIDGNFAIGRPALRLDEFRRSFGSRGLLRTVCQADYSQALDDIGALVGKALSPCLEGTLDTTDRDSANPGLQPDCTVSEIQGVETDAQTEQLIPRCRMLGDDQPDLAGAPACWWVKADPACATETQLALQVERSAPPPKGSVVRVSCAGVAEPAGP